MFIERDIVPIDRLKTSQQVVSCLFVRQLVCVVFVHLQTMTKLAANKYAL